MSANYESSLDASRIILLNQHFDSNLTDYIIPKLLTYDIENNDPIHIYINSPGGSVATLFTILDTIDIIKSPVYTYNIGISASCAALLLLYGHKRYALRRSKALIHSISCELPYDVVQEHRRYIDVIEKTDMAEIASIVKKRTRLTIDWETIRELWYTSSEQLTYGIVDKILNPIDVVQGNLEEHNNKKRSRR